MITLYVEYIAFVSNVVSSQKCVFNSAWFLQSADFTLAYHSLSAGIASGWFAPKLFKADFLMITITAPFVLIITKIENKLHYSKIFTARAT